MGRGGEAGRVNKCRSALLYLRSNGTHRVNKFNSRSKENGIFFSILHFSSEEQSVSNSGSIIKLQATDSSFFFPFSTRIILDKPLWINEFDGDGCVI